MTRLDRSSSGAFTVNLSRESWFVGPEKVFKLLHQLWPSLVLPLVNWIYIQAAGNNNRNISEFSMLLLMLQLKNHNHRLSRLPLTLTMSDRFETINQYYPIRGYSFMPSDRTFGVLKRAVKKHGRIYSPEQYKVIICNAKNKYPGYEDVDVQNEDILNFKEWWPHYFKKTSISTDSNKQAFTISKYRHIVYSSKQRGYVQTSEFIDGAVFVSFKMNKTDVVQLPTTHAYSGKVPIKKKKINDVSSVLNYIPDEYRQFYTECLAWPTSNDADNDDLDD
ncbi:hypothetical protein J6590_005638 [Homalodisca vitripennis]|nr:hypothetical protein J6590_005638 [Homalodisca vitripennis]